LVVDSPSAVIGPELAVPLGLLVTEAITNAYKHAFKDRDSGQIRVEVARDAEDKIVVRVRDNGTGFDPTAESNGSGLGRSLIEAFVRQLRGELETKFDGGTVVEVRFPAPARSEPKRAA
jgi:two-component sensor histidine kinase